MFISYNKYRNKNSFFVFTKKELAFIITIFILGIIIGATIISAYSGKDLDKLIIENNELKSVIEDQETKLEQMDQQYKNRLIVQTINPYLDTDLNKHTQQEIIKKIRSLLAGLVGKELSDIDPLLLHDIINEASIIVEGHSYQLSLAYMVVSYELGLYLKVINYKDISNRE